MVQNSKLQQVVDGLIQKAVNINLVLDFPIADYKLTALQNLHTYCIQQVLKDPEVMRDPRKINYVASHELKLALVGICLSDAIVNPSRKNKETKDYFEKNINIYMRGDGTKVVSFGDCEPGNIAAALYPEIMEDWKIYRDREGMGIQALIDEKTNLIGLSNYHRGGHPAYEFARFHRKYTEKEHTKEEQNRFQTEQAFRTAMVQSLAQEISKQQLSQGADPMKLLENLFGAPRANRGREPSRALDPQLEKTVNRLLEYGNSHEDNGRER